MKQPLHFAESKMLMAIIYGITVTILLISDERFMKMTTSYEAEQKQLEERVVELQKNILQIQERSANIDAFLNKVHQYTDI